MNSLGIYFGPSMISIVESKGKRLVKNLQIPLSALSAKGAEEKVPDEVKIVALCKDELRKNKIDAKEATIALSGKDLIIRTFDMPLMPRDELETAVSFEVKKYIPFKLEELISDFQVELDKANRRNQIVFVGIKKEVLDKYLAIFGQLNLKIQAIEYSAFSTLRLLKLAGISDKGAIGIINVDFQEKDEVNFTVLGHGFPLFSRDITLTSAAAEGADKDKEIESGALLEKLKTEIRISLEYYERIFSVKKIEKIFFISGEDYRAELEAFTKEMGLPAKFIELKRCIGNAFPFSLACFKGYGAALSGAIKTNLKINLLAAREKKKARKENTLQWEAASFLTDLKLDPKMVILGLALCAGIFIWGLYRTIPARKDLDKLISLRPPVFTVDPNAAYEQLNSIDSEYKTKISAWDNLLSKQVYMTQVADATARLIPDGIWLTQLSLRKEKDNAVLTLGGSAYLADNNKELILVNSFVSKLKEDAVFSKYFKDISIVSLEHRQTAKLAVTVFTISCRD